MSRILALLCVLFFGCEVPQSKQPSSEHYWPKECQPLMLVVSAQFDDTETTHVLEAADYWNSVVGAQVFTYTLETYTSPELIRTITPHSDICGLVYVRPSLFSGERQQVGLTALVAADPADPLGESLYSGAVFISSHPLDRPTHFLIVVHELGHVLGLGHNQDTSRAVMSFSLTDTELVVFPYELTKVRNFMRLE